MIAQLLRKLLKHFFLSKRKAQPGFYHLGKSTLSGIFPNIKKILTAHHSGLGWDEATDSERWRWQTVVEMIRLHNAVHSEMGSRILPSDPLREVISSKVNIVSQLW
jgi:hypothetical protein